MSLLWPERLTVALEPLSPEEPQPWQGAVEDFARRIAALEEQAKRLVQVLETQERERSRLWELMRRDIAEAARVHQDRRSPG